MNHDLIFLPSPKLTHTILTIPTYDSSSIFNRYGTNVISIWKLSNTSQILHSLPSKPPSPQSLPTSAMC